MLLYNRILLGNIKNEELVLDRTLHMGLQMSQVKVFSCEIIHFLCPETAHLKKPVDGPVLTWHKGLETCQ